MVHTANLGINASPNVLSQAITQTQAENAVWVFSYVADNIEECTKTFRKREKCEAFAVNYMSQVYNYKPTGNIETDLAALEELWRLNEENDSWFISLCLIED